MTRSRKIGFSCAALGATLLALALNACGRASSEEELQIDSNTNWLMRCDSDAQCSGSLRCYCGQCSQPCSQTDQCGLLIGAECSSALSACSGASAGGLCVLGCQSDAECGNDFSCSSGQCVPRPCEVPSMTSDDLYAMIAYDLLQLDSDDAPFTRYLGIANHSGLSSCGATLTAERQGASKLVNSLSTLPTLTAPAEVDVAQSLYRIDLRDYGWDHALTINGATYADVWEAIAANNPFAVPFAGDDADDASADTGTTTPVMFVNSFVATTTRPDIYYAILGIPETREELGAELGVAASPDLLAGALQGEENGGTSIVSSHWQTQTRTGYLWEIADNAPLGTSLLQNPLRPPAGDRELIFSLPNGLQAFATMAARGTRSESSDNFLDTEENDFRARAPRSLLRVHSPRVVVEDDVRAAIQANPGAFAPDVEAEILRLYAGPEAIDAVVEDEFQSLTRPALETLHVDVRLPEPITLTFAGYDRDVDLETAAGEFMMSPDDLRESLDLLAPELGVLNGGRIDRDDFAVLFVESLCILSVVNENMPLPGYCY
jgi:hypothetical protein